MRPSVHFCKVDGASSCEGDRHPRRSDGQDRHTTGCGVLEVGHSFVAHLSAGRPVNANVLHVALTEISTQVG